VSFRIRARLVAALAVASAVGHAAPARGQVSATLEAGGMHTAAGQSDGAAAFTMSPALRVDRPSLSIDAAATLSRFADFWSGQASVATSYFTRAFGPFQGELSTSANSSAQPHADGTGTMSGGLRLHWFSEDRGLWLGAQAGRATDGDAWRSTTAGDAGAWIRFGGATAVLQLAPSVIGTDLRYVDASTAASIEHGRLELAASVGFRDWREPTDAATTGWGTLAGTVWLNDHLALAVAGGSYPADWAQGFAEGKYVSVGVRLATHRPTARQAVANAIQRTLPPASQPVAGAFRAERAPNGEWILEVTAPAADGVELMGDFTDWRPIPLRRRADGQWAVTVPIVPGTHRINLRVGTGPWGVPPGLPISLDEFSSAVALLVIDE